MKKRINIAGLRWSIKEIVGIVIGVAVATLFLLYLSSVWQKFGAGYTISLAALTIASIAGIGTLLSLKWTRDTVRPFLTVTGATIWGSEGREVIKLAIRNTGPLPADDVTVDFRLCSWDSENSSESILDEGSFTFKVIFPNQDMEIESTNPVPNLQELIKEEKIKVGVTIKYKSIKKECETVQVAKITQPAELGKILFIPIGEEEYWY